MEAARSPRLRRPRREDRLEDVVRAGAEVFARRGYRRTQMADVAAAMGVSPGNLYNYVDSKDALFYLVLRRMLGERPDEQPLQFPVTDARVTVVDDRLSAHEPDACFSAALSRLTGFCNQAASAPLRSAEMR